MQFWQHTTYISTTLFISSSEGNKGTSEIVFSIRHSIINVPLFSIASHVQ